MPYFWWPTNSPHVRKLEQTCDITIAGIENIVVVQNKVDIVSKERAIESYQEILSFIEGTIAEGVSDGSISAHHDVNLDMLIQAIEDTILVL